MPGVNPVAPRVQGGLLDTVLKGVQVARDVYGIRADMAKTDQAEQATEQQKQNFEDEQAGIQPASQKPNMLRFGNVVDKDTPGAIPVQFKGDDSPMYMAATRQQKSPLLAMPGVADPNGSGKFGTAFIDPSVPNSPLMNWHETLKQPQEKSDRLMTVQDTDENGNPVTKVVPMVAGASYANGKAATAMDAASKKASDAEEKTYTEMVGKIATPGRNRMVQQAQMNLLNVSNAQELIQQYPDLNQMPPQKVALLNAELAKISSGGVASEHGQDALAANTLSERFAKLKSQVGGEPTGAQVGAFIQQNAEYLQGLQKVSQDRVDKYGREIYASYKHRLSPELQNRFETEHADLFGGGQQAPASNAPVANNASFVGTANAAPQLAPTKSGYMPGSVLDIDGVHYRVSDDGKNAVPIGGK